MHRIICSLFWASFTTLAYLFPTSSLFAGEAVQPSDAHLLDARFSHSTFVLNLEKQGLEDNTFTNGLGRDTTLIGNLVNASIYTRLLPGLEAEFGVFTNMPFGHDTEISQVRPILRLTYQPSEELTGIIGTLRVPHQDFHNAVFYRGNRFLRPIEQGAQMLVNSKHYRQDLFINWEQAFRGSATNRYDVLLQWPFRQTISFL